MTNGEVPWSRENGRRHDPMVPRMTFSFPCATICNIHDIFDAFLLPFCNLRQLRPFPSNAPACIVTLLNCIPFGTDITDMLRYPVRYVTLVVARELTTGLSVTTSDGNSGPSAYPRWFPPV